MSNAAEKLMSLKEFLAWEREQPERYEYLRRHHDDDRRFARSLDDRLQPLGGAS